MTAGSRRIVGGAYRCHAFEGRVAMRIGHWSSCILILACGGGLACTPDLPSVPKCSSSAWPEGSYYLQVREDEKNPPGLLLRCLTSTEYVEDCPSSPIGPTAIPCLPILRFIPGIAALETVDVYQWIDAKSAIHGICQAGYQDLKPFEWDRQKDKLVYQGTPADTQGRWIVMVSAAPSGNWVAVLSANRKRQAGFWPLGGTKYYSGAFFHEIRRRSTGERVGTPVRLADSAEETCVLAYWTHDGSHTIYKDSDGSDVWIVPNVIVDAKEFGK